MNTHNIDIQEFLHWVKTEVPIGTRGRKECITRLEQAAIEADRSRGEPVAWIQRSYLNLIRESNVALHNVVVRGSILDGDGDVVPLYTAPQHAEPIVSDVEAIVRLLERREWADHVATTPLGQRLETAVTVLVGADQQPSEPDKQHPDDAAVDAFATAMKAKLAKKRSEGRDGWQECSAEYLSDLLRSHVEKGDPVDVANLAMMLYQNGQGITPAEPVKVLSDADILDLWTGDPTHSRPVMGKNKVIAFARAILARYGQHAQPTKSSLKVSYDKYGDCLYVVCDSNEPALSDEDDKGILYRRAISDGRLVGITILDFMGRHAKSPDEPVHETARTAGNGAESGMNTGPQGGAHSASSYSGCGCNSDDCRVNGCLSKRQTQSAMAPGGGGMPAEPVKVPSALPSGTNYSVEPHGNGYAIYQGRDGLHHGANLAHLTECTPEFSKRIEAALNAMSEPVEGARVDHSLPELSIVWHDSPEGVDRAMWEEAAHDAGLSYEDLRDSVTVGQDENGAPVELTHAQTIDAIRNQGCWGFVDTNTGTIHAWAADDADPMLVVHMLAHEIGHMTGEQHPDELQEEMRAEQFGRVAAMAFRMWRQRWPLTIVEGAQ